MSLLFSGRHVAGPLVFALSSLLLATSGVAQESEAPAASIQVEALPPSESEAAKPEKSATQLEAVQVTGSRIKRADVETEQPVVRITRKDLERTGETTIGDVLQALPSAGSALNTNINNGGTGATEVDLRNLGSGRVLVLVDGHRWISGLRSLSTNSVDLNTIPFAIVERIDVLQDGASAAYGSDAITGVVNIITKKKLNGIQLSSQVGAFTQGDGRQQLHALTAGNSFDTFAGGTSLIGSFSFQDQAPVFARSRKISRLPKINTGLTRGSTFTPEGRALFVASDATTNNFGTTRCASLAGDVVGGTINTETPITLPDEVGGGTVATLPSPGIPIPSQTAGLPAVNLCDITRVTGSAGDSAADYRNYVGAEDAYNFTETNYLATPLRTYNAFLGLNHQFNEFIAFDLKGVYSLRQSTQQLAPHPISIGDIGPIIGGLMPNSFQSYNQATFIPASNPFNPTRSNSGMAPIGGPQDIGRLVPSNLTNDPNVGLGLFYSGALLRRIVEGDPRIQQQNVPTRFGTAAFNGDFNLAALPVSWELGYGYGVSSQSQNLLNNFRQDRIRNAIVGNYVESANNTREDQGIPDDVPLCVAPCVPLNLFGGPGTITPEMLAYILYNDHTNTRQAQANLFLNFSTTLPVSFLPNDLGVAFGVERRTSKYTNLPSAEQINNTTSGLTSLPTNGATTAKEAFVELDIPLAKDVTFIRDLGLSLAGRVSDYGEFGKSINGKIGGRWKPVQDLLLRSTFSTSFRAPTVGELFLGNAGSYPGLDDPCANADVRTAGSNADANCDADGVPDGVTQVAAQILSPFTGNPDLEPETSHSLTAGFVFSPEAIKGFDLSVDYYRIALDNFINPPGAQTILDQCYTTPSDNRTYCNSVIRDPNTGSLVSVINGFANMPRVETAGIDFLLNYQLPLKDTALAGLGRIKLVTGASFLSSYAITSRGATGNLTREGQVGTVDLPRWKINPSIQWSNGGWQGSLNTRIIWGQFEDCDDGIEPTLVSLGLCSDPNYIDPDGNLTPRNRIKYAWKTDAQFGYRFASTKTELLLGMENIFNRDPPISYSAASNSFQSQYWLPGRLGYLSLKQTF